ncbi:hypothetical protein Salat_0679200 [Sesamum alatum]|uniref:Uncharacterized protein n=1 Tax=Sesamum alatum TaxID=300844 RepID=A0AAE1YRY8_9LAMI|nr:hypothetical protein Salat_0679200 [Sesamum alatum]
MLKISCSVDDSEVLMNISGDKDALNMFSRNENWTQIEVFVELCGVDERVNKGEGAENESEVEKGGEDSENEIEESKKEEDDSEMRLRGLRVGSKDLELDVPLAQLASRKRKAKVSSSQFVAPTRANKKTQAKLLSQSVRKPPISSSQPLPNTEHGPSMPVAGSSLQPLANLGASYLPPSFRRGLGVSPQMELRSKKNQNAKAVNPDETCKQQ